MLAARSRRARSTQGGQETREQILSAAEELMAERGYSGLSISAICRRADISPTSVYWHFDSKAGLMEAVIGRIGAGTAETILTCFAGADGPEAKLEAVIAGLRELVINQPSGSLSGVAILSEGRHVTEELAGALRTARRREIELVAATVEEELGAAVPYARSLAVIGTACVNYAALTHQIEQDASEVDRVFDALRDVILRIAGPDLVGRDSD
jgi:AcrR family transcriptional regulator